MPKAAKSDEMDAELMAMADWLGNGEVDMRLMLRLRRITPEQLRRVCRELTDSPWFEGKSTREGAV